LERRDHCNSHRHTAAGSDDEGPERLHKRLVMFVHSMHYETNIEIQQRVDKRFSPGLEASQALTTFTMHFAIVSRVLVIGCCSRKLS
jgi:hypothetical protein